MGFCHHERLRSFLGHRVGEANFLGGVASVKGVTGFDPEKATKRFFEIYLDKNAKPNSGIGFPGALELIMQNSGLKVAVASSADRVKVDANLAAAGFPISMKLRANLMPKFDPTEAVNIEPSNGVMNSKYLHRFISRELPPRLQQGE